MCDLSLHLKPMKWTANGLALVSLLSISTTASAQENMFEGGHGAFVVSHIEYALGKDAADTGACPNGMSEGYKDIADAYFPKPDIPRMEGEKDDDYRRRVGGIVREDPAYKNLCLNPELGKPNPLFRTISGADGSAFGIDLDGVDSHGSGQCAHDDFSGMNGETGIDNQFFRVVGCSNSFQSTGQSNTFATEMLTGSWGMLITLDGVDDLQNDDSVDVGIYSNADPIQLSASREPLPYATYAIEQDPRFRFKVNGRIKDGVLVSDTLDDFRFHWVVNSIRLERPLRDARVQMTFGEAGIDGYIAGYAPVEAAYDFQYGFRNGTDGKGEPASLRLRGGSSLGQARVQGHTCEGAYYAMHELADGHPDPESGKCTSISTQYKVQAIPAYVVDVETDSVNDDLIEKSSSPGY